MVGCGWLWEIVNNTMGYIVYNNDDDKLFIIIENEPVSLNFCNNLQQQSIFLDMLIE